MNNKAEKLMYIKDFYQLDQLPVYQRMEMFSAYFREQITKGLPVQREVMSPAANRVSIKDNVTGEIRETIMFGSNNYLGLANNPDVRTKMEEYTKQYGIGLGGPPLLNGTTHLHRLLEQKLAAFKGTENAMLYSSGFGANYGMINALVGKKDALITDSLSHASIMDGARTCRGTHYIFPHNNPLGLERELQKAEAEGKATKFVVVEGVYSMDGDIPPLDKIYAITKAHDGFLIIDDAHGTGVMGEHGGGIAEAFGLEGKIDLVMGTFSKAFASSGGFLAGTTATMDYLRFFSRTYFFSAAPPPVLIAQALAALETIIEHPELRTTLFSNVEYILSGLRAIGYDVKTSSAVIPVYAPEKVNIRKVAREFDKAGIFINHIEYPAVPLDKQRFRISVMATHTKEDMDTLLSVFDTIGRQEGLLG